MRGDRLRTYPDAARKASSAALVLIGALALYGWVLAPHVGYLHAMQQLESVVDRVAEERDRIGSAREARVRQWRALQREVAEREEGVFTAQEAGTFLRGLLPRVEKTGCTVLLADFTGRGKADRRESPDAAGGIEASHLNLVVVGQPEGVLTLLQRLVDHRPRIWIDSCQCDFSAGRSGPVECTVVLTFFVRGRRAEPVPQ